MACVGVNEDDHRLLPRRPSKMNMRKRRGLILARRFFENLCFNFLFFASHTQEPLRIVGQNDVDFQKHTMILTCFFVLMAGVGVFNNSKNQLFKNRFLKFGAIVFCWQAWEKHKKTKVAKFAVKTIRKKHCVQYSTALPIQNL